MLKYAKDRNGGLKNWISDKVLILLAKHGGCSWRGLGNFCITRTLLTA